MFLQDIKIFANVITLKPSNLKSIALDWRGDSGFFDECTSIARRRGLEDGFFQWTGALIEKDPDIMDSYDGDDHSVWHAYAAQGDRKCGLTLNRGELGLIELCMSF